jgi:hypothetical protein
MRCIFLQILVGFQYMWTSKPKGQNRVAKIGQGFPYLSDIDLSFNKLHYLGIINFKHKYNYIL